MKEITLRADERLIRGARKYARVRHTTLNQLFRDWLASLAGEEERARKIDELFARLDRVDAGGKFSRLENPFA